MCSNQRQSQEWVQLLHLVKRQPEALAHHGPRLRLHQINQEGLWVRLAERPRSQEPPLQTEQQEGLIVVAVQVGVAINVY